MRWPLITLLFFLATGYFRADPPAETPSQDGERTPLVQTTPHSARSWAAGSPIVVTSDTVKTAVRAGRTLIVALPDSLTAYPVVAYRIVRAPALSWLVDRTFLWRTMPADTGRHSFRLTARLTGELDVPLVVQVDVR